MEAVVIKIVDEEVMRLKTVMAASEGTALDRLRLVVLSDQEHGDTHDQMLEHLHQAANAEMHVRLLAQLERRWQAFPGMIESLWQAPAGSFYFLFELEMRY